MKINNLNQNNLNFSAKKVAKVRINLPEKVDYELFHLTSKDNNFLKTMKSTIVLKKLWENLKTSEYSYWQSILNSAAMVSNLRKNSAYLLTRNKKACGILNYTEMPKKYHVNYLTTWPIEKNKKEPLTGKVLLLQLFKDMLKDDLKRVELSAIRENPFGSFKKFFALNFIPRGGNEIAEDMTIGQNGVKKALDKFSELINIENVKQVDVDLSKEIKLPIL